MNELKMEERVRVRIELVDISRQFGDNPHMTRFDEDLCARFNVDVGGVKSTLLIPLPRGTRPDDDSLVPALKLHCRAMFRSFLEQTSSWEPDPSGK